MNAPATSPVMKGYKTMRMDQELYFVRVDVSIYFRVPDTIVQIPGSYYLTS